MSAWTRARRGHRCGSCGEPVPVGAPLRVLTCGLLRCARCALQWLGEEAPADLPEAPPPPTPPAPRPPPVNGGRPLDALIEHWRARLGLDWKARAAGDES
jgi:hypothetical protein